MCLVSLSLSVPTTNKTDLSFMTMNTKHMMEGSQVNCSSYHGTSFILTYVAAPPQTEGSLGRCVRWWHFFPFTLDRCACVVCVLPFFLVPYVITGHQDHRYLFLRLVFYTICLSLSCSDFFSHTHVCLFGFPLDGIHGREKRLS